VPEPQLAYLDKLAEQPELADMDFDDACQIIAEASRRVLALARSNADAPFWDPISLTH